MIAYQTFHTSLQGNWTQKGVFQDMEALRQMAQQFINQQVGVENVVTITEYVIPGAYFYITVWYRGQPRPRQE